MSHRRGLAPILVLLAIAGCGSGSRTSRLEPGTLATVQGPDDRPVAIDFAAKTDLLPAGTVVRVISDREGDPSQARRKVMVSIQSAPSRGLGGQVDRANLRPGG